MAGLNDIACGVCGDALTQPGALLFGVPRADGSVLKTHLCVRCYPGLLRFIAEQQPIRHEIRDRAPNR